MYPSWNNSIAPRNFGPYTTVLVPKQTKHEQEKRCARYRISPCMFPGSPQILQNQSFAMKTLPTGTKVACYLFG